MVALEIHPGDFLSLWVADRAAPPATTPVSELQKGFAAMGLRVEVRGLPGLLAFEAVLSKGDDPPEATLREPFDHPDSDAFEIEVSLGAIRLRSGSRRGFSFSVWELMESLGWSWPTPEIDREPDPPVWTLPLGARIHCPILEHRILFAEQIEIPPRMVLWLSRNRFNTIFPSNPSRFSDPEKQLPDSSLAMAKTLGFDLIVGGDCGTWFAEAAGLRPETIWSGATPMEMERLAVSVSSLLEGMEDPVPRLSVWPPQGQEEGAGVFLRKISQASPELRLETTWSLAELLSAKENALFHVSDASLGPLASESEVGEWAKSNLAGPEDADRYLLCLLSEWDGRLGRTVSPLLWRRLHHRIRVACEQGLAGAGIGLLNLDSSSYLERAGFSIVIAARAMWNGPDWDPEPFAREIVQDQFETAGKVVLALSEDFERWIQERPPKADADTNGSCVAIRFATQVVPDENIRDKIDQRISEIEESAPCETCIELARSLSNLVSLYDLEECADKHEAKALARIIWRNNVMDRWPDWLQESSPLAERLRGFL